MDPARRLRRFLRTVVTPPLVVLAALLFLIEEYCWDKLTGFLARLSQIPTVRAVESRIASLGPFWAATLFLIPIAFIEPIKIFALFLMGTGHFVAGALVFLSLKIFGTAALAWLFRICRPALLTVRWFARTHDWVISTKVRLYARVKAMTAWRATIQAVHRVRIVLATVGARLCRRSGFVAARYRAARRAHRRAA